MEPGRKADSIIGYSLESFMVKFRLIVRRMDKCVGLGLGNRI